MAASDGARKKQAEWPPHPDRVFMALAAAWFETGEDTDEGAALRWLEALPPPAIAASEATCRVDVTSYVPVNDTRVGRVPAGGDLGKLRDVGLALLPEYRPRQARGFPVAIPVDPRVHLIWTAVESDRHFVALASLAAKVTHVGHSASLVQAWMARAGDFTDPWVPTKGIAAHRLRIPSAGRLDRLAGWFNRDALLSYRDLQDEIQNAQADLKAMKLPPRTGWRGFPDAVLLAAEMDTKRHSDYVAAKSGNPQAAAKLVEALVDDAGIAAARRLVDRGSDGISRLVCAHAYEREGLNAIPAALAQLLCERLGIPFDRNVVQTNIVGHTGADGYGRLARQAAFGGEVPGGRAYVLVDDFIGQGGTLANLRGWIEKQGAKAIGAVGLTGKPYSAKLKPTKEQLDDLRRKHGRDFEKWWREHFGHSFDCLTHSEARYLARSPDVDRIRNRLAAAKRKGGGPSHRRSPREQRQHIKALKARSAERFPDGSPRKAMRPLPGKWQGYSRPSAPQVYATPRTVFDPNLIVLTIQGRRTSLPATLKLTTAMRGLLMRRCPVQPPPEWFSGHRGNGEPTRLPHLALVPLAFVGSQHADGHIMGLALALPRELDPEEVGCCLEPLLRDADHGLPREHRLFSGDWLECRVELETRERPAVNLIADTWTSPSRVWASVTPVVLNRHFDGRDQWARAAESLKDACAHIGLPQPRDVLLQPVSSVEGVPHAREFPQLTRKRDGGSQSHSHALIIFDEPVRGPVMIGAGRFRGYGLCRPMDAGRA